MVAIKDWLFGRKSSTTPTPQPEGTSTELVQRAEELITQGNVLEDKGDFASALKCYRQASDIAPGFGRAWVNIGNALQLMGQLDDAIVAQQTAVRLAPDNAAAHYNLGALLARRNVLSYAERELREALRLKPDMADAAIFLGDVLAMSGRLDEAEAELRRALQLRPASPIAANNLAGILMKRERVDEAEDVIRRGIELNPDIAALNGMLGLMYLKSGRAREAEPFFRAAIDSPETLPDTQSAFLFSLNLRDDLDAESVFREHRRIGALIEAAARPVTAGFANRPEPDRTLKVGYVSGDFRQHPVALFMRPVLERHARGHFEVYCYANNSVEDEITGKLKSVVANWRRIVGIGDADVAERIRQDGIDILVDLSGHTAESRLGVFAHRPAPVQVTWLGYLNTTGLITMDYRICDWQTDPSPDAEALHTERLCRLPHSQWCYAPVYSVAPANRPCPDAHNAVIFGSFNQFAKISDACVSLWCAVLARLPAARLRVFGVPEGRARSLFIDRLTRNGLDADRVSIYGRVGVLDYFKAIGDVDIALDTWPYNGATTTLDTLWMGVPIVALRGARGIERGSFSINSALGAPELLAATAEEYVEKNVRLAEDRGTRQILRDSLRQRLESSPLMDAEGFTRDLESSYRKMWRTWCEQQAVGRPVPNTAAQTVCANTTEVAPDDHRDPGNPVASTHDSVVALFDLGRALKEQGKLEAAVETYRRALSIRPDYPEAHYNLGNAFKELGRLDEAVSSYRKAISARPDFAEAHVNMGLVLQAQGRLEEAADSFDEAISWKPNYAGAHNNLGNVLGQLGQLDDALASYQRAVELDEAPEFKANFVHCIKNCRVIGTSDGIRRLVARAISEPWVWRSELATVATNLIKADPIIGKCIERASGAWPTRLTSEALFGSPGLAILSSDGLLRALLENSPVCDVAMERCLTMAREAVLERALASEIGKGPEGEILAFCCALARQCFINEYVFSHSDGELNRATQLREMLAASLRSGKPIPEMWIAAVAAYFPLLSISDAEVLLQHSYSGSVMALLVQQITEPIDERRDRRAVPRFTAVAEGISSSVQMQYEENPYPRWMKLPPPGKVRSINDYLQRHFPAAPFRPLDQGSDFDFLIAGCGTGWESIGAAQQFPEAHILAIDLSLSSLCYARRKAREIGLKTIEHAQADITKIRSIGRMFDVVSSVGVLHHLADPIAGLRELVSLLRPNGFMHLGLYSESARQVVVAARKFIVKKGYGPTAEDIRRCRQDLIERGAPFAQLTASNEFYTTSECRDLLFHVQESRLTLPQIKEALRDMELEFIGFDLSPRVLNSYAARFPDDRARTDLDCWHQFETASPDTFAGMYNFWVQRTSRSKVSEIGSSHS